MSKTQGKKKVEPIEASIHRAASKVSRMSTSSLGKIMLAANLTTNEAVSKALRKKKSRRPS